MTPPSSELPVRASRWRLSVSWWRSDPTCPPEGRARVTALPRFPGVLGERTRPGGVPLAPLWRDTARKVRLEVVLQPKVVTLVSAEEVSSAVLSGRCPVVAGWHRDQEHAGQPVGRRGEACDAKV